MSQSLDSLTYQIGLVSLSAIVLIVSAGITSHIVFGYGTIESRNLFFSLILLIMVAYQYSFVIKAANFIPATRFDIYNTKFHRSDCLASGKGGKRPMSTNNEMLYDVNPCYAYYGGDTCTYQDGIPTCSNISSPSSSVDKYLSYMRDCDGGQGITCGINQPCQPCDRDSLPLWKNHRRCRSCSSDFQGDCQFIPGVGPYCYASPQSKSIVPCTKCCTEGSVLIINGTCY